MTSSKDEDRSGNLLTALDREERAIRAVAIYEKLTADFLADLDRNGGWHLVLGEGGRAAATIARRQLTVRMSDGGSIWYAVQLSFLPLPLVSGRNYRVSFKVRAQREQTLILDIAQVGTWYSYSPRVEYKIGPEWQELESTFSMGAAASEPNARFEFNLGGCGANEVVFEDVAVTEI
ncbi:hypothetical protein DB347_09135 [Opitutaceae bacterium EW11]|nr:hypothetical protein DB347_09135 [Opitutaceae bacterium EW11]